MTVAAALDALRAGHLVVLPTDTVYGVAADPSRLDAVAALFVAKGRSPEVPIPVLAHDIEALRPIVELDERALKLGRRFWPGPLTLVLPRAPGFEVDLGGDAGSSKGVGVRVPDHQIALEVLRAAGPLAVTSANRSGEAPATTVTDASGALGGAVEVYLDGGLCDGPPSTVVSLMDGLHVLRRGALGHRDIERALSANR